MYDMLYGIQKADGIYNLLKSYNNPINKKSKPLDEFQLFFNFD